MLKPKFRDIGKLCVALDGDIYSELDYDWITNQFPNTEQDLIPSECVPLSNSIIRQERGCSVFYSCLGPADEAGTQNPMQVFYRERYRKETANIHRPYRISRVLVNETSPETQFELVGPLAFYQARYAEGVTGVQPNHAQTLPGLTEDLGQQINRFGYTYGETQDRSVTDHYQQLIELIVSYICNGDSVSLWQEYQTDTALLKPVDELTFYQIAQRVWESLPSKSLQVLFSAAWGSEEVQNAYTLTCPTEGKFKGDSTVIGLIGDGSWTNYDGWLKTSGQGNPNYHAMSAVAELRENHTFEPFIDFMNWEIKQSGTHESLVGVPFLHKSQTRSRSLSGHRHDLLRVQGKPGEMFMIPRAFEDCTEDPFVVFQNYLPEFNLYQVDLRISALFADHQWAKLYDIINWSWYDSIDRQQEKNYTSMLRNLKFIKGWEGYITHTDPKCIHLGHDAIYKGLGPTNYFWYRDEAKLIEPLPNSSFAPLYKYIYLDPGKPFDVNYEYIRDYLDKDYKDCLNYIESLDADKTGPWSEFKKKIRESHGLYLQERFRLFNSTIESFLAREQRWVDCCWEGHRFEFTCELRLPDETVPDVAPIPTPEPATLPARREEQRPQPVYQETPRQPYGRGGSELPPGFGERTKDISITFPQILTAVSIAFIMFMLYMIYYNRTHFDARSKASPTRHHQPAKSLKHPPTKSLRYDD